MSTTVRPDTSGGRAGLPAATVSEWTKLWSVASTFWTLVTAVVLMVGVSTQLAFDTVNANTDGDPATAGGIDVWSEPAVSSIILVQYVVVAFAMLVMTSEYASGSITSTLQWVPRRHDVILAKAAVLGPVAFVTGCALTLVGTATAAPWLGEWGTFDAGTIAQDTVRTGVYVAVLCLLTLGVSAVVRSSVAALTTMFLVLGILPGLTGGHMLLPAGAGQSFLLATPDPWSPAVGLCVLTCWAAAALAAGIWVLRVRDA